MARLLDNELLVFLEMLQVSDELEETIMIDQPLSADEWRVVRAFPRLMPLPDYATMPPMHPKSAELAEEWRTKGNQELSTNKERAVGKYTR